MRCNTLRYFYLLFIFLFFAIHAISQQVNLEWVKTLRRTNGGADETYMVGIDAAKNVYVAAHFTNTLDIDPGPDVFNVSTPQFKDIYVIKLDPKGSFVWGKQITGSRDEQLNSMAVDPAGNIVLTGSFDSPNADFDPGASVFTLSAKTQQNAIFICKLDKDGNFNWAKKMDGPHYDSGWSVVIDKSGNIITTGNIWGSADIDPGPGVLEVGRDGTNNPFISKLDPQGDLIWGEILQTYQSGSAYHVRVDDQDNIYLSGSFQTSMDFDPGPGSYILGYYLGSSNPFLAKYDRNGKLVWGKKDVGMSPFAVDRFQNIYLYGGLNGYGWGKLTKLSPLGDTIWSKNVGSGITSSVISSPIELDIDGNIYLAGMFRYTQDFDPGPGETKYSTPGNDWSYDICISKLDLDGNFIWAKHVGSYGDDFFHGIQVDNAGNVYTTGTHQNIIDMDPNAGEYIIRPEGGGNQFILKLSNCKNTSTNNITAISCYKYELNGITYTSSGNYTQHLTNSAGCDSLIQLQLQITGSETTSVVTSCNSYNWEGQSYTNSGRYSISFPKAGGCDSIRNLELTIGHPVKTNITADICDWNVYDNYSKTGIYLDTFQSVNGCDSIRTLYLTVHKPGIGTINASICAGDNYEGYTETGVYYDYYITPWACDSTRILNLTVNPVFQSTRQINICDGESFYTGGANQTVAGTYTDIFSSQAGCDSLVTTLLTVKNKPYVNLGPDKTLCSGDFLDLNPGAFTSYVWHDQSTNPTYRANREGTYSVRVTDNEGCTAEDEITINKLLERPANFLPATDSICDNISLEIRGPLNFQRYHWSTGETTNGIIADHPGNYTLSVTDINGCSGSDTIRIVQKNCYTALYMPTAFTPNSDQRNDQFRAKIFGTVTFYHLEIFNRNGVLVFRTTDPQVGWNGDYRGIALPNGVFVWQCTYQLTGKERQFDHGTVTLIRN